MEGRKAVRERRHFRLRLLFVIFTGMAMWMAAGKELWAAPKYEFIASADEIPLDSLVTVEARLSWPTAEGEYKFQNPDWPLTNLKFNGNSQSDETLLIKGQPSRRRTVVYEFTPLALGKAKIGYFKLGYINLKSKEAGSINFTRSLEFNIVKPKPSGFWFLNLLGIILLVLVGGGGLAALYYKKSAANAAKAAALKDQQDYQAIVGSILVEPGENQKEALFDWSKHFKTFLILHYDLPKTVLTESDALELLKQKNLPKYELEDLLKLSDQLSQAKYSSRVLSPEELKRLQNKLATFIQGKQTVQ